MPSTVVKEEHEYSFKDLPSWVNKVWVDKSDESEELFEANEGITRRVAIRQVKQKLKTLFKRFFMIILLGLNVKYGLCYWIYLPFLGFIIIFNSIYLKCAS